MYAHIYDPHAPIYGYTYYTSMPTRSMYLDSQCTKYIGEVGGRHGRCVVPRVCFVEWCFISGSPR